MTVFVAEWPFFRKVKKDSYHASAPACYSIFNSPSCPTQKVQSFVLSVICWHFQPNETVGVFFTLRSSQLQISLQANLFQDVACSTMWTCCQIDLFMDDCWVLFSWGQYLLHVHVGIRSWHTTNILHNFYTSDNYFLQNYKANQLLTFKNIHLKMGRNSSN